MKSPIILLLLLTGAFFSCKKQEGNIVIDGQGDGSQLQIFRADSFTINAITVPEDSLPGNGLAYSMLGNMADPLLGKTRSSIFAALSLTEPNSDFPNTLEPDSAILYIPIIDGLNFYGNPLTKQKITVYPLAEGLSSSTVYYQKSDFKSQMAYPSYYQGPIFNAKYDSIRIGKGKVELHPGLKIKLSMDVARMLMHLPKSAFLSNENLLTYFHGFSILADETDLESGQGGIGVFDLANAISTGYNAKVMLYYSDTQTFVFGFSGSTRTVTSGKTGPYPSVVQEQLAKVKSNYNTTYVQALSGVKTKITIPYLLNFLKNADGSNIAINKAEISFYIEPSSISDLFYAPPRLNLFQPLSPGSFRNALIPDALYTNFGGNYNATSGKYTFIITRHVQNLLNTWKETGKEDDNGMYLSVPTGTPVLSARAAIDHTKTQLKITWTKLN